MFTVEVAVKLAVSAPARRRSWRLVALVTVTVIVSSVIVDGAGCAVCGEVVECGPFGCDGVENCEPLHC